MTEYESMREAFIAETSGLLDDNARIALVLADISAGEGRFAKAAADHPDRVLNVGIREQLLVGVAGGLALTGLRPIVHTYAPFLIERAFEQVKLDIGYQQVGAILVSVGASYDWSEGGSTHFSPRDVSLLDSVGGWSIHVPGHPMEVAGPLRDAAKTDEQVYIRLSQRSNSLAHQTDGRLSVLRHGGAATVVAVGPMLDNVLAATEGLDVTVAYTNTVRPFDTQTLRALGNSAVVLVEPYLTGTSDWLLNAELNDSPHRILSLGVGRRELHAFGTPQDHDRWHGLDPAGIRASLTRFLRP